MLPPCQNRHSHTIRILRKHGQSGMKETRCPEQFLTVKVVRLSAGYASENLAEVDPAAVRLWKKT